MRAKLATPILGFLLNDKLKITEKIINQSEQLASCVKINATSTAKEADDYSVLITENEKGFKLLNTGTIDPYCNMWGLSELTDQGSKYLKPYLPINSKDISGNRNKLYASPKIIISKIGLQCEAFYDEKGEYASINTNCIHSFNDDYYPEYILCWINSKLYNYMFECFFDGLRMSGGYLLFSSPNLRNTYIKNTPLKGQKHFIGMSQTLQNIIADFNIITNNFNVYISSKFELAKLSRKLQNWHELDFGDFIKELNKAINKENRDRRKKEEEELPKLTKKDEFEWMELFEENKKKAVELQTQIDTTEKEIDEMVYELYGLSEEEIKIVEES